MPAVVVDTDVVSYLFKKDTHGRLYRRHLLGNDLVVSFMTLAELEQWALRRGWGMVARERLQPYRVYDTDPGLCRLWAEVMNRTHFHGQPMDKADAWIAATALALAAPLVTNNPADFAAVDGLTVGTAAGK